MSAFRKPFDRRRVATPKSSQTGDQSRDGALAPRGASFNPDFVFNQKFIGAAWGSATRPLALLKSYALCPDDVTGLPKIRNRRKLLRIDAALAHIGENYPEGLMSEENVSAADLPTSSCAKSLWSLSRQDKLGLALSGGGFRASLFHIGVLARMAELDLLTQVRVLSTVSGGSIIGAYYYLKVKELLEARRPNQVKGAPITQRDYIEIVQEIEREFLREVQTNIRMQALLDPVRNVEMLLSDDYSRSDRMAELYDEHFYHRFAGSSGASLRLADLKIQPPSEYPGFNVEDYNDQNDCKIPVLNINATSLNTGHRWVFTSSWVGEAASPEPAIDTNITLKLLQLNGTYANFDACAGASNCKWAPRAPTQQLENLRASKLAQLTLADAVAASACVPAIFTPLSIHDLYWNSSQEEIVVELVDGGVFDNQGLDALFEADCTHIICSDASGQLEDVRTPASDAVPVARRSNDILMTRVRSECYAKLCNTAGISFAFFHLRDDYPGNPGQGLPPIPGPVDRADSKSGHIYRLSNIRTDLDTFTDMEAYALMYDGYCLSDANLEAAAKTSANSNLGAPGTAGGVWNFFAITRVLKNDPEKLLWQLKVGASLFFKVFYLDPLRAFPRVIIPALLALAMCWPVRDTLGDIYLLSIEYGVGAILPVIGILALLKKVKYTKPVLALTDLTRKFRRRERMKWLYKILLPIGLIGTAAAKIHLRYFDPLFRDAGKLRSDPSSPLIPHS